ncbi:hypothetical protein [Methanogenium organophilum]|uniref:Lipoprotein n=1 Tax=Methanogenium organophilum TaxID=2199 RepID=A0A9X9S5W5_METOG|nr:hypothetical protein [Methanogenium organophilum]WAI02328.1 hypothetical protein OU421_05505 [Methanogenium organophilum]
MKRYGLFIGLLCCCLGAAVLACGCIGDEPTDPNAVSGNGTIVYQNLEGGFYGIVTDDGTPYLPLNLPDEFAQDNLSITFTGVAKTDVMTIQQWGTPLELTEISSGDQTMKMVSGTP